MLGDECFCVFLKCVFDVVTFGKMVTIARLIMMSIMIVRIMLRMIVRMMLMLQGKFKGVN